MRRLLLPIAILAGLHAWSATALAAGGAGYNLPSKRLEAAFKVAQYERAASPDGCYPTAGALASAIRSRGKLKAAVAKGFKKVRRPRVVYVIRRGASCGQLRMALRFRGEVWVLNAAPGTIKVRGRGNSRQRREAAIGNRGRVRALKRVTKTFRFTRPNVPRRLSILCPGRRYPLGGGMWSRPGLGADGEGIYPHSYERLGVQRGWHINPFILDSSPGATTPRRVTLQVICARGLVPMTSPRKTVFIRPGQAKTAVARCPKGQFLFAGGFQRTNFLRHGGDYITESRAVGARSWRVSGAAFGEYGGELTAIAHCVRHRRPLLTRVSTSVPVPAGATVATTTRRCPRGRRLTVGGFSMNGSRQPLFAGGSLNRNGTWSVIGHGYFGSAASLTAYGYCLQIKGKGRA